MRGTVGGVRPVGTGVAEPSAVEGVADGHPRGVWLTLASRWASAIVKNCVESNAGTRGKALRSEDDADATMPDARCAASMTMPATAQ